jgi:hypothetical protein
MKQDGRNHWDLGSSVGEDDAASTHSEENKLKILSFRPQVD